jgi:CheY-like chemotaxis protein
MKKVLLIDDDKINNFLSTLNIKQTKIASVSKECLNGEEAIEYLNSTNDFPDLILLDINMPFMDGWQFLEIFQQTEKLIDIPVYILTSSNYDVDMQRAMKYTSVKGYIVKPLKKEVLFSIFEK